MEIIPAIDIRGGKCVRLRQGDYSQETVFADDPVAMAHRWADAGASRLHLVDLDAARGKGEGNTNREIVRQIVREVDIPCQLGGGIRDDAAVTAMLEDAGLERVIIGTQALKQPQWFRDVAQRFPGRIVLGLDVRNSYVATEGWLEVSRTPAVELARKMTDLNLAAVVYTNIANDGMMQGVDDATIADMVALTQIGLPVIASGGVTTVDDVRRLTETQRKHPLLVGAIIGRALYEGTLTVSDAVAATE